MAEAVAKKEMEELLESIKNLDANSIIILKTSAMALEAYQDLQKEGE